MIRSLGAEEKNDNQHEQEKRLPAQRQISKLHDATFPRPDDQFEPVDAPAQFARRL